MSPRNLEKMYALLEKSGRSTPIYGLYTRDTNNQPTYQVQFVDEIGTTHYTNEFISPTNYDAYEIAWWLPYKDDQLNGYKEEDKRLRGSAATTFPQTYGWKIDGTPVELDSLTIKLITYFFTQRKFKPPLGSQAKWQERLGLFLNWYKIWKIKSLFASPRDQITWLKLMHRNLYIPPNPEDNTDESCPFCHVKFNEQHLSECKELIDKVWNPLLALLHSIHGIQPDNIPVFITLGQISKDEVICKHLSVLLFLAWRCVYAEIIQGRLENKKIKYSRAYHRAISMTITRITAYARRKMDIMGQKEPTHLSQLKNTSKTS